MSAQKPQAENKSKARIKGIGSDVRLTQCPRCKRFADKYVEHDFVVLFIDLVLVKPQVGEVSNVLMLEWRFFSGGDASVQYCCLKCYYRLRIC